MEENTQGEIQAKTRTAYCQQQAAHSVWPFAVVYNAAQNIEELELTTSSGLFDMLPYDKLQLRKWAESSQLQSFIKHS